MLKELEFWVLRQVRLTAEERRARGIGPDEELTSYKTIRLKASEITNRDRILDVA